MLKNSASQIVYSPRPDTTPEGELNALAACFRFILDCHAKKEAAHPAAPNDVRKDQDAHTATQNYTG